MQHKVLASILSTFMKDTREIKQILENNDCQVEERISKDAQIPRAKLLNLIEDVDAFIVALDVVDEEIMKRARQLKIICKFGVGVDNIDISAATRRGIVVTNLPGINSSAVADLTIGLIICLARQIVRSDKTTRLGKFEAQIGVSIEHKTLGIIGFGSIGKKVAQRAAQGFGMRILIYDIVDYPPPHGYAIEKVALDELLKRSDFVSLHCPSTDLTRSMITWKKLEMMQPTTYLINTARGSIVNELDLYRALKKGRIAGAALDTFAQEPPMGNPLFQLDNVIVTAHIGGATHEGIREQAKVAAENVIKVLNGQKPRRSYWLNPEVHKNLSG